MMSRLFLFIGLICISNLLSAQLKISASSNQDFNRLIQLSAENQEPNSDDLGALPLYKINGVWYVSLIGKMNLNPDWNQLMNAGSLRGSITGNIATVKVPLDVMHEIDFTTVFSYLEIPGKIQPHLDKVIKDVRADSVQFGLGLPEAYTGTNVIIGVTDWGFDYTHPMFYDTMYQQTRILAAWDQFKQGGDHPSGFSYGAEYDNETELLNAQSDTANIYSYGYHGTHVAGIAGGSGGTSIYRGMAPAAEFLFATFLIDYASVIDAFHWMKNKAQEENKRLVINMSWGLYYIGTLDGNSLLSQAIDQLSSEGVVFVASAGNNGSSDFHIKKEFTGDEITTRVQFDSYSNPNLYGQSISMWGEPGNSFHAGFRIYNNLNVLLDETPVYQTEFSAPYLDSMLISGNDTVYFNLTVDAAHPLNGRPHMRLRIKNTNTSIRVVLVSGADEGTVHFWNLVELTNGVGNWGLPFVAFGGNTGVSGDSNYSISEPTCTASVISVAAYSAEYINVIGNLVGGQIATFSSIGPLMTEVVKPDIAAPGVNVVSSMSAFSDATYSAFETVSFNGTEYDFAKLSGTSMASPCVAGVVALLLDANPFLMPAQVKEILQQTAREDEHTGDILTPPGSTRWGYGKVNALRAVQLALETEGLNADEKFSHIIDIYPNPASDILIMNFPADQKPLSVVAFDVEGRKIDLTFSGNTIDVGVLASGYYTLQLITSSDIFQQNFMIVK